MPCWEGAGVGSPNGLENHSDSGMGQEFDALTFLQRRISFSGKTGPL